MAELEEEKWGENRQELIEMYEGFIKGRPEELNQYKQKLEEKRLKVEKEKFVIEMFENTIAVPGKLDLRYNKRHLSRKANELYQQNRKKLLDAKTKARFSDIVKECNNHHYKGKHIELDTTITENGIKVDEKALIKPKEVQLIKHKDEFEIGGNERFQ